MNSRGFNIREQSCISVDIYLLAVSYLLLLLVVVVVVVVVVIVVIVVIVVVVVFTYVVLNESLSFPKC